MQLTELVTYLDTYLGVREVPDYREALNGLQVENDGEVTRIGAAVDLCEASVQLAAAQGVNLLLVHHGLFWGGLRPLVGPRHRRIAGLMKHNIALYSAHLPLDRHPDVGNNAVLARALDIQLRGEFGMHEGVPIGVWGELSIERTAFQHKIATVLGSAPRMLPFGPAAVRLVGVITGAGGSKIPDAAAAGLDTYVTGEGPHHSFFDAEELRVNVFYSGHYLTETVGVKALAQHVSSTFRIPWAFLDHPTGL